MSPWRAGWRLATSDPGALLRPSLFWLLLAMLQIPIGLVLRAMFDRLSEPVGINMASALAVFVALSVSWSVVLFAAEITFNRLFVSMVTLQHRNALSWLLRSAMHRGELPGSPGDGVGRLHDDPMEMFWFIDNCIDVVNHSVFATVAIAIMFRISPAATAVVVLPLVGVLLATRLLTPRIIANREADREAATRLQAFIGELYGGVLAVKVARAEDRMLARFDELGDQRRQAALKDRLLTDVLETFNGSTVNLAIGLMLLIVAVRAGPGDLSVGDLALFVTYLQHLGQLPRFVGRLSFRVKQTGVSVQRMAQLVPPGEVGAIYTHQPDHLNTGDEVELPDVSTVAAPVLELLEVRDLRCEHASGRGLQHAAFSVERGSFTVVTGPVGAGKTTLLRAIIGLARGVNGDVVWNGEVVSDRAAFFVPDRCAYLPQVPRLFSEPLEDNIRLGSDADHDVVRGAIYTAAFERDLERMPEGLATVLGPRGTRLSGGQIQRAAAARAFLRRPELLVIDDLSSALDTRTERQMWDRLGAQDGATTFLLVSNRRAALERADQVILVEDGRVTATGPFRELLHRSPYLRGPWPRTGRGTGMSTFVALRRQWPSAESRAAVRALWASGPGPAVWLFATVGVSATLGLLNTIAIGLVVSAVPQAVAAGSFEGPIGRLLAAFVTVSLAAPVAARLAAVAEVPVRARVGHRANLRLLELAQQSEGIAHLEDDTFADQLVLLRGEMTRLADAAAAGQDRRALLDPEAPVVPDACRLFSADDGPMVVSQSARSELAMDAAGVVDGDKRRARPLPGCTDRRGATVSYRAGQSATCWSVGRLDRGEASRC